MYVAGRRSSDSARSLVIADFESAENARAQKDNLKRLDSLCDGSEPNKIRYTTIEGHDLMLCCGL